MYTRNIKKNANIFYKNYRILRLKCIDIYTADIKQSGKIHFLKFEISFINNQVSDFYENVYEKLLQKENYYFKIILSITNPLLL